LKLRYYTVFNVAQGSARSKGRARIETPVARPKWPWPRT